MIDSFTLYTRLKKKSFTLENMAVLCVIAMWLSNRFFFCSLLLIFTGNAATAGFQHIMDNACDKNQTLKKSNQCSINADDDNLLQSAITMQRLPFFQAFSVRDKEHREAMRHFLPDSLQKTKLNTRPENWGLKLLSGSVPGQSFVLFSLYSLILIACLALPETICMAQSAIISRTTPLTSFSTDSV